MFKLEELIEVSRGNHYKLLTLVGDNPNKEEQIINYLKEKGWGLCNLEEVVLEAINSIPESMIDTMLGKEIKNKLHDFGDKLIITNIDILYSPEVNKFNPIEFLKYPSRNREMILFLKARMKENTAIYSTPDREDYCEMDLSEVVNEKLDDVIIGGI